MGKRGPKPKFTDISYPNKNCKFHGISGKKNIMEMAHIKSRTRGFINISAVNAVEYSTIEQTLFFDNLRKDEFIIKLALKMAIRGMSTEGIADMLEV